MIEVTHGAQYAFAESKFDRIEIPDLVDKNEKGNLNSRMAPTIQRTIARTRAWILSSGMSPTGIALKAGLSERTLRNFDKEAWNPTRATLEAIERLIPEDFPDAENDADENGAAA